MSSIEKIGVTGPADPETLDREPTSADPVRGRESAGTAEPQVSDTASHDTPDTSGHERADLEPTQAGTPPGPVRGFLQRAGDLAYRKILEPLVLSRNPPWFDARGVAFGLMVGFGIPMGIHTVVLALVRCVARFNFVVSMGVAAVVNPLTIVPLYYGYYCLGSHLLGQPAELDRELFATMMHPIVSKGHSWEAIHAFSKLSGAILTRWVAAAAVVASLLGIISYMITEKIQDKRCRKAAKKMGMSYRAYLQRLEKQSPQDDGRANESPAPTESTK